jgi:hypothetical protein
VTAPGDPVVSSNQHPYRDRRGNPATAKELPTDYRASSRPIAAASKADPWKIVFAETSGKPT